MTINPETLDIKTLPWLPLEEKAAFPKKPAIYFAIDSQGIVQYIGCSVNVRQRWGNHHKYDALSEIGNVKIAYLFVDAVELLPEIEAALIEWFNPPLNSSFSSCRNTMESVTTYVPPEIKRNLEKWAKEEDRSISYLVAKLITEAVNQRYPQKSTSSKKGKDAT